MSDVQFETDQQQFKPNAGLSNQNKSGLSGWLIKHDLAKDETGANKVMIVILILNVVLIYLIVHYFL